MKHIKRDFIDLSGVSDAQLDYMICELLADEFDQGGLEALQTEKLLRVLPYEKLRASFAALTDTGR